MDMEGSGGMSWRTSGVVVGVRVGDGGGTGLSSMAWKRHCKRRGHHYQSGFVRDFPTF